tara:strand:- start:184 stop:864 length:681 start_codon:yes stop_codon:yes gene_type:complete
MLQLTDKRKIYFYLLLILILISFHNINFSESVNSVFKIKEININGDTNERFNKEISDSLYKFKDLNIFRISPDEIKKTLESFNYIGNYKIKKKYPSLVNIEYETTKIIAYYFENNQKFYIGENGKKIKKKIIDDTLPLIIGDANPKNFLDLRKKIILSKLNFNDFTRFFSFKSNRWDLEYKNNIIIKLPIENINLSLKLFKDIIEKLDLEKINIIDLRMKNHFILS